MRVKARGDERVYLVLFAYRTQQKFGRRRADDCGEIAVLRAEERIYSLFVLLPELFDHLFRVHKAQKAEKSALHLVAAYLQKEAGEADELIGKNDYQPRVPDKAEEIEHALRVNGENGLVKIIEVEFHFVTP